MDIKLIMAYTGAICILLYFLIMIYLHVKFKNYNPIFHAVSDYGVGNSRKFQIISGVLSIIGSTALISIFLIWDKNFEGKNKIILWLFVRIFTVIGVVVFLTDIEGDKKTGIGLLHYLFAILQFTAVINLTSDLTSIFTSMEIGNAFKSSLSILNQIVRYSLAGVILAMLIPILKKVFGLIERVFLFSSAIYFLILNIVLITILKY